MAFAKGIVVEHMFFYSAVSVITLWAYLQRMSFDWGAIEEEIKTGQGLPRPRRVVFGLANIMHSLVDALCSSSLCLLKQSQLLFLADLLSKAVHFLQGGGPSRATEPNLHHQR